MILRGKEAVPSAGLGICRLGWFPRLSQVGTHGGVEVALHMGGRASGLIQGRAAHRSGDVAQVAVSEVCGEPFDVLGRDQESKVLAMPSRSMGGITMSDRRGSRRTRAERIQAKCRGLSRSCAGRRLDTDAGAVVAQGELERIGEGHLDP